MKKLMAAAMALAVAAPTAASAQDGRRAIERWAGANDRHERRLEKRERREERREYRQERREDRREYRHDRRDDRRYYGGRHYYPAPSYNYYYTPPRTYYYSAPSYNYYSPGYSYYAPQRYYRGGYLPYEYRRAPIYNYHAYGYGPPPYGHAYYRTSTGEIVLAAIATGLILSVIAGAF